MECVSCGAASFNRVVVEVATDERRGGLCADCEQRTFGLLLAEPLWRRASGCGLCANAADASLPGVDCVVEYDDGRVDVEFDSGAGAPALCRDHLHALLDVEPAVFQVSVESYA